MSITLPTPGTASDDDGRDPVGTPAQGLSVWTDQQRDRCVLTLQGRLGASTVTVLQDHMDRLGCRWCDEVVVDLSRLSAMDSVGARLLVGLEAYVAGRGGRFSTVGGGADARRLISRAEVELSGS